MTFHYIEFKTYCHATEELDKVKEAMFNAIGKEIDLKISEAEGYYGNPILILKGKIERNRDMDNFFENLDFYIIDDYLKTIQKRIDERCNFYFRLDKQKAYKDKIELSDRGDTIRVRARIESYPAKREKAINNIQEYLSGFK
ncbi:MAG: RNA-binding domain-containing protein [Thermoplasmatota archaeon]